MDKSDLVRLTHPAELSGEVCEVGIIPAGRGLELGSSTTGSKNVSNGSGGYAVQTVVNAGSELLIFVRPVAHSKTWVQPGKPG
jgi:hypothetical protein